MIISLVLIVSVLSLLVAVGLARWVLKMDNGTPEMRTISDAIQEGAEAFLKRQYRTIGLLSVVVGLIIFLIYEVVRAPSPNDPHEVSRLWLALATTASFFFGALCSGIAGYVGMFVSIRANIRAASAARTSLNRALQAALRGGAVSGLFVVAMSLLGVGGLYFLVHSLTSIPDTKIPLIIVGYGFGASFVALFAQLGGGIYTKAADVGADLVGKVEAGIPEDDPRNPAVIADLVGDNVGDCAGRGADLFESTAAENIGAMILGATLALRVQAANPGAAFSIIGVMLFPLVVRAFGLVASIVGVMVVKTREDEDPMQALNRGYWVTALLAAAGFVAGTYWLLQFPGNPGAWWHFALAGVIGIATSIAFVYITQYYTEYRFRPVKAIAAASVTGPATNIISGFAVALECTALPAFVIGLAIISSYDLGNAAVPGLGGLFGTAVATMGMLGTAAYILAMDTFGPITDNAGGIIEMSKQPEEIRRKTDRLDAVGNTTKALTKGYAVGSAALAAFLLFSAYMDEIGFYTNKAFAVVDIAKPEIFVAALLGAMLIFWFSSLAINAVQKAAVSVIKEVRRQFAEDPGILAGTSRPNYARCVDIVTVGALKEMVAPGLLAVGMPILVGLVFRQLGLGAEAVASFLMVATITGILVALMLNNGGGAWDNAKKFIEMGEYGGKGSDAHKAGVVGDTVGDPFKDTAGPSLHVVIKLLSTVTLVLAPLFI
jgi:K(+)-stimulated pyrophosphate-energized sodium pump